jgi:hypothetical protein
VGESDACPASRRRQADALRAYQRLRLLLDEELGVDPSPPLVALEEAVLQQKPELDWIPSPLLRAPGSFRPRAKA